MKYSVESIEDGKVILENSDAERLIVDLTVFSDEIKEGYIVIFDGKNFAVSDNDTAYRRKLIFEKQQRLIKKRENS